MQLKLKEMILLLLNFIIIFIPGIQSIIGYDCGSKTTNITAVSLLDIGDCNSIITNVTTTPQSIMLLQSNKFTHITLWQCNIKISRTVKICGMFSHSLDVKGGFAEYIQSVTKEECIKIHQNRAYTLPGGKTISGLNIDKTNYHQILLSGKLNSEGACEGASYSDPYGDWDNVFVMASIKIDLYNDLTKVDLDSNKIILPSGTRCNFQDYSCVDPLSGNSFWNPIPNNRCYGPIYSLLFQGTANLVQEISENDREKIYIVNENDITFAFNIKGTFMHCGHEILKTNHPRLFIFELDGKINKPAATNVKTGDMDLFAYVNSKFLYVERHIRRQIKDLYSDILKHTCNLEQKMIANSLLTASLNPDEFALQFMKKPGYMAVPLGEVIYIIQCIAVDVKARQDGNCYKQLPITWNGNISAFLTPKTHIITNSAIQIDCNNILPPMFKLENSWYKITPHLIQSTEPFIITPSTKKTWKYSNPANLATSGIYTPEDLNKLRDHIMVSSEVPALVNTIIRLAKGIKTENQGLSIMNLIDDKIIEKITDSTWNRVWGNFLNFGNISAGIIGILFIFRAVKYIVDIVIHGYTLHTIYGWSIFLLGSLWDSVTHLLVLLSRRSKANNDSNIETIAKNENHVQDPPISTIHYIPEIPPRRNKPQKENIYPNISQTPEQFELIQATAPPPPEKPERVKKQHK